MTDERKMALLCKRPPAGDPWQHAHGDETETAPSIILKIHTFKGNINRHVCCMCRNLTGTKICSACGIVRYCSTKCQTDDRKYHADVCVLFKQLRTKLPKDVVCGFSVGYTPDALPSISKAMRARVFPSNPERIHMIDHEAFANEYLDQFMADIYRMSDHQMYGSGLDVIPMFTKIKIGLHLAHHAGLGADSDLSDPIIIITSLVVSAVRVYMAACEIRSTQAHTVMTNLPADVKTKLAELTSTPERLDADLDSVREHVLNSFDREDFTDIIRKEFVRRCADRDDDPLVNRKHFMNAMTTLKEINAARTNKKRRRAASGKNRKRRGSASGNVD